MPKIVVVDDAQFMRNLLGNIIKSAGYNELYYAEDGLQAVEKSRELQPEIVTLDISMPGMDGLEAIEKILEVSPQTKIIMVSAVTGQTIIDEALQKGAVDFIKKPFDANEIQGKIKQYTQ
ncbi:MAG: response regulator [Clostridia bacterium]|nr:response regulator [Clostridia bacterium]